MTLAAKPKGKAVPMAGQREDMELRVERWQGREDALRAEIMEYLQTIPVNVLLAVAASTELDLNVLARQSARDRGYGPTGKWMPLKSAK
jgi:hypothetical protein